MAASQSALSDAANDGIQELLTRSAVFIGWVEPNGRTDNGSGVVLKTPKGKPFLLSAAHVIRHAARFNGRVGWHQVHDAIPLRGGAHYHTDPKIDVGIYVPEGMLAKRLSSVALPIELLDDGIHRPDEHDVYQVVGFPSGNVDVDLRAGRLGFQSLTWPCSANNPPRLLPDGRLGMPWVEPGTIMHRLRCEQGESQKVANAPEGMSGGSLWRYRPMEPGTLLWDTRSTCKIVAVQSAWYPDSRVLILEGTSRFHEWLMETVARVDEQG